MGDSFEKKGLNAHNYALNDFAELYNNYFSRIHFFIIRLVRDEEQARDLTADVFVKLWSKWGAFESEEHIRSWLYVTAKNAALNWIAISKRRSAIRKEMFRPSPNHHDISESEIEQSIALAELMKEIYDQTADLPPQSKKVFDLIYIEGKSTREIATILSIAPKTVLNYKLHIIQKLRTILLKKGFTTSGTLLLLLKDLFF